MADVYEQNLASKSTLTTTDYIRVVGSDNVSYKQLVSDVAKKIIENYTGSTLAGSAQSVKSAVDSLNSKTKEVTLAAGASKTLTATSYAAYMITFHGYNASSRGALVGITTSENMQIYNWLGTAPSAIATASAGTRQMRITNNDQYEVVVYITAYRGTITVA